MDDFEKLIEKYRRELVEFSKNCPAEPDIIPCGEDTENEEITENEAVTKQTYDETDEIENNTERITSEFNESAAVQANAFPVPKFDSYDEFLKANPQSGTMRVQVYAAGQSFPIANAAVTLFLELTYGRHEIFEGLTDINGVIDGIILPAPSREMSQSPSDTPALPYSSYGLTVEHPDFADAVFTDIPVFSGIKSIQGVELVPLISDGREPAVTETDESGSFSRVKGAEDPWQLP